MGSYKSYKLSICNSLISKGLKGSAIRASLIQLSQLCHVVIRKLTKEEIRKYTRRASVKRLRCSQDTPLLVKKSNLGQNSLSRLPIDSDEKYNKCKPAPNITQNPHKEKCNGKENEVLKTQNNQSVRNKKLEKRLQELFGNDSCSDIIPESKEILSKKVETAHISTQQSCNEKCEEIATSPKKRKHCSENTAALEGQKLIKKKCKLPISDRKHSLNNGDLKLHRLKDNTSDRKIQKDKRKKNISIENTKPSQDFKEHKIENVPSKVTKTNVLHISTNTRCPEEDPSIKELWSILGMESPTDRSDRIKSHPPAINKVGNSSSVIIAAEPSKLQEHPTNSNESFIKPNTQNEDEVMNDSLLQSNLIEEKVPNEGNIDVQNTENEPFLKITEAFSLAESQIIGKHIFDSNSDSCLLDLPSAIPKGSENPTSNNESRKNNNIINTVGSSSNNIETICLDDDDDDYVQTNNMKEFKTNTDCEKSVNSNVGRIRVKSIDSLMKPQITTPVEMSTKSKALCSNSNGVQKNNIEDNILSEMTEVEDKQKMFSDTYHYYFDQLVECKIPKLGELLHLAIADNNRKVDRYKRAEQLSSKDLIEEEKVRAEKEFSCMMKNRGAEFTPLFMTILNKFEDNSKKSLFTALLCRIFKHAEKLDPCNKELVSEAQTVIRFMLSKINFTNKVILEMLQSDPQNFKKEVEKVQRYLEKCYSTNTSNNTSVTTITAPNIAENTCNDSFSNGFSIANNKNIIDNPVQSRNNSMPKGTINETPETLNTCISNNGNKNGNSCEITSPNIQNTSQRHKTLNKYQYQACPSKSKTVRPSKMSQTMKKTLKVNKLKNYLGNEISSQSKDIAHSKSVQPAPNHQTNQSKIVINSKMVQPALNNQTEQTSEVPSLRFNTSNTSNFAQNKKFFNKNQSNVLLSSLSNIPAQYLQQIILNQSSAMHGLSTSPASGNDIINLSSEHEYQTSINQQPLVAGSENFHHPSVSFAIVTVPQSALSNPSLDNAASPLQKPTSVTVISNTPSISSGTPNNQTCIPAISSVSKPSVNLPTQRTSIINPVIRQVSKPCDDLPVRESPIIISAVSSVSTPSLSSSIQGIPVIVNNKHFQKKHTSLTNVNLLNRRRTENNIQQNSNVLLNNPVICQSKVNASVHPIIVRDIVDPSVPAIVGMDPNHLSIPVTEDNNQDSNFFIHANSTSSSSGGSSTTTQLHTSTESTTSTQPNLPVSSHCHPFIERMPLSGKMRMMFDNVSNS